MALMNQMNFKNIVWFIKAIIIMVMIMIIIIIRHEGTERVIQTRVEVWENEKCCENTSHRRVFPQLFRVLPNFHECLYNSIETQSTVCGPWYANKSCNLEYLTCINTKRAEIFPEDSFHVSCNNLKVARFKWWHFPIIRKKGDSARRPLVCGSRKHHEKFS